MSAAEDEWSMMCLGIQKSKEKKEDPPNVA
jgi:hypothetical protein